MSFRQNGQHRYGHVPPAQYTNPAIQDPGAGRGLQRQSSFDNGDDASFLDNANNAPQRLQLQTNPSGSQRYGNQTADELYMTGTPQASQPTRAPFGSTSPALSGYQHQYQPVQPAAQPSVTATPTYNPQQFARAYSTSQATNTYHQQAYNNTPNYGGHQPYVPAAYHQQPQIQRQQTLPSYATAPSYNNQALPPLPPTPQPTQYWQQQQQQSNHYPQSSPPIPQNQSYTPPMQYTPFVPSNSAPLPARPSPYTPPLASAPYPTNGGGYAPNDYRVPGGGHQPYQPHVQMPAAAYPASFDDPSSFSNRASRSSSQSATNQPPQPTQNDAAPVGLQRHPTRRPLPSAPMEEVPEPAWGEENQDEEEELQAQEQIYQEIEAAMTGTTSNAKERTNGDLLDSELGDLHRYNSRATTLPSGVNRHGSGASHMSENTMDASYDDFDDDSDAEGAAGVLAMRIAEEQDAQRGSGSFGIYGQSQHTPQASQQNLQEASSDSDYGNVDMGMYGGGYDAHMSYGDDLTAIGGGRHSSEMEDQSRPLPMPHELRKSDAHEPVAGLGGMTDYALPAEASLHPFPAFEPARVDTFGTGGLQRPSSHNHRLSFDEGDESLGSRYSESRLSAYSGSESPSRDDIPEMFYHPGMSSSPANRPLPAVPSLQSNRTPQLLPAGSYRNSQYQNQHDSSSDISRQSYHPDGPDGYSVQELLSPNASFVPRSASLSSHSSTPQVIPPTRSRTDAEERQARQRALRHQGTTGGQYDGLDVATPQSSIAMDLPSLPMGRRRKISPANLKSVDFRRCYEPWALSNIAGWLKELCGGETGEGESDLREKVITECLVALFTHKVPTMNTADAEVLSERLVNDMFDAGVLLRDEEWVKFGPGTISGVLWQMTGSGCYAPKLHEHEVHGRCYSFHCGRTLKKMDLSAQALEPSRKTEEWHVFFHLTKEQIDAMDKKELQRQMNQHEIVMSEDKYMDQLNVLRILYRDQLQSWQPPIIAPAKIPKFIAQVFGKVEAVKKANEEHLLAPLKYRQHEQGPMIVGFSDIFREWIRKARQTYLDYAAGYSLAVFMVRREAEKNILFQQFLDQARENKMSLRLDWVTYLFAPLKRLQQYTLMLREVLKHSILDTEEKTNLITAIEEINNVTLECDAKVAETAKKTQMQELSTKLFLRPGMERVELQLDHLGRELIFQGDLQRAGSNRFTWLDTHALLFDHYLVLAKIVIRDGAGARKREIYDVSKLPIPMQLLILESSNDEPMTKSTMKGLTVATSNRPTTGETRVARASTSNGNERPSTLEHTNTSSSIGSTSALTKTVTSTNLEGDAKTMYPFRVKHLGKSEVYTLYASTLQSRQEWCEKIIEAKERHAAALFAQNAEPFRLKVMADSAFAYDAMTAAGKAPGTKIKGTPLDRAIREMEREYGHARPGPVCRAAVNCATTFSCFGKSMVAIGTDFGVYTSEISNPRGWTRSIQMSKVTQISIIEDFSLCLIIADKALIAYHLDVIVPPTSSFAAPPQSDSGRRAPQKLSGSRDVAFFATARMKDRTLVFYKKRDGLSSSFKVLEPIHQKSSEKKSKLFSRAKFGQGGSNTEFFREFDEFYIPTDCFTINLFHTYIAISTQRGFELLTLDKKVPMSIPDLKDPSIATIAARLTGQKPLGMFRLSTAEFLLCYEECACYIDAHGSVSRSVVLEFVGRARGAALFGAYLVLFDSDFVEVRNAENGRLRQVIAGRDVRCLDYGVQGAGSALTRTLKIAMAHPEVPGSQLVVELLLNEGQRE